MCTHLDSMCTPSTLSTGKKYDWAFPTNQLLLSTPVLRNSASSSPFGLCCISLPRACVASLYDVLPGLYAASLYDAPHGACVASLFYAPPVTSSNIKMMILCTIDRYDTIKTRPASRHKKRSKWVSHLSTRSDWVTYQFLYSWNHCASHPWSVKVAMSSHFGHESTCKQNTTMKARGATARYHCCSWISGHEGLGYPWKLLVRVLSGWWCSYELHN